MTANASTNAKIDATPAEMQKIENKPKNGAEILIQALQEQGVDIVFGYPGGAVLHLYDAMYKNPIRHILTRHEQGAIHAKRRICACFK